MASANISDAQAKRPRLPEIRLSAANQVPVCVTPERLMQFTFSRNRNAKLRRLYKDIALYFKKHGEALGVRWDYAFYQTMIETNYLTFRTGSGRQGDVNPNQFNFAGIGTTGGGVPGDGFGNVSTGVLAQMQHLIAYSGAFPKNPVAPRTRLTQRGIVSKSRKLGRPVRFDDLAGRWAVDRRYAAYIESVARRYRKRFCTGRALEVARAETARSRQQVLSAAQSAGGTVGTSRLVADVLAVDAIARGKALGFNRLAALGASNIAAFANLGSTVPASVPRPKRAWRCRVMTASYGGTKTVLIKAGRTRVTYTALGVLEGLEKSLADSYIKAHAKGGWAIAEFATQTEALQKAFTLCPTPRG